MSIVSPPTSHFDALEQALCANERQGAFLEAIDDKLKVAMDEMKPGEARDREIYRCWMLLWTAREIHERIDRQLHDAHEGILAERRKIAA